MDEIGERLKAARVYLKYSQTEFARRIGIRNTQLGKYELGHNNPSHRVLERCYELFRINPVFLLTGKGEIIAEQPSAKETYQSGDDLSFDFKSKALTERFANLESRIDKLEGLKS